MPYSLIDVVAQVVLVASSAYLLRRLLGMMMRLRWARNAYPKEVSIANSTPEAGLNSGRRDRHRGVLVGLAVGDALGLPAESLPPWLLRLRYRRGPRMRRGLVRFFRRAGAISDDTQLSICVARSITPEGSYLHERFRDELCLWYGYRIAAGRATTQAVRRLRRGDHDDPGDPKSEGNGAAIRAAPLAMAHADDPEDTDLIADVKENARLTHRADKAVSGSVFWALLVWEALRHPREEMSDDALEGLFVDLARRSCFPVDSALAAARLDLPIADRLRRLGTSGHIVESIHAAIMVLLHHGWHDYHGALETIFWAGGDTDSLGSMVGAVIGAQVGLSGIPPAWGARVAHRATLIALADRLALRRAQHRFCGRGEVVELEGDVATRPVDAIVNAWNRNMIPLWLLIPQGVSRVIRRAGGRSAIRGVALRAPLPLGSATETRGFDLPAPWVIHVAGINALWRASEASVRMATQNALNLARCRGLRSLAFPLLGAGSGGLSSATARSIIVLELRRQRAHFDRLEIVHPVHPRGDELDPLADDLAKDDPAALSKDSGGRLAH